VHTRFVNERTRDEGARYVHVSMRDNAANLPPDYVAAMMATKAQRPSWYRSFVLGEWGAFEGAAFPEFEEAIHVVEPFEIPEAWERFESMDHGTNNPTAWHAWAADHDGNLVIFDEYYGTGLVSKHAPAVKRRRAPTYGGGAPAGLNWWNRLDGGDWPDNNCWADPSIRANHGHSDRFGWPASIWTEYRDHDVHLIFANNDRRAGYLRLLELLHPEPGRVPPPWSHVPAELGAAPRLYAFSTCERLIEQLKSAPVAVDGANAGEAVDGKWESAYGHATSSARYGAMSRPSPSPMPEEPLDPREEMARRTLELMEEEEEGRYVAI